MGAGVVLPGFDRALRVEVVQHRLRRAVEGVEREVHHEDARLLRRDHVAVGRGRRQQAQPVAVAIGTARVDELRPGVRGDHPLRCRRAHDVELVDGRRDAGGVRELEVVGDVVLAVRAEEREGRCAQRRHDDGRVRVGDLDQLRVVDRVPGRRCAHRCAGRGADREGGEDRDRPRSGSVPIRSLGVRWYAGGRLPPGALHGRPSIWSSSGAPSWSLATTGRPRFGRELRFGAAIATARGRRPPGSPPQVTPSGAGGAHPTRGVDSRVVY